MKIIRSTKCSLKFATDKKHEQLGLILEEYGNVCNFFISYFWHNKSIAKAELLKPIVNLPTTWLSARLRKVAAREALDMVAATKERWKNKPEKAGMPFHKGSRMVVSSTIISLKLSKKAKSFDAWLHFHSIGNKVIFDIPIKYHKHFNKWDLKGKRLNAYIITKDYVQLCFKIETGPKLNIGNDIGIDTGINKLAVLSNGKYYGEDIKNIINDVNRKRHGSKNQKQARLQLKQYIDEVAKQIIIQEKPRTVVVENLTNISKNTKSGISNKETRKLIGSWNYRYWLTRLQNQCEENRVFFRTVSPYNTSITCSNCGNVDKKQRSGEEFICSACGHKADADYNASINILNRCLRGAYGPPPIKP